MTTFKCELKFQKMRRRKGNKADKAAKQIERKHNHIGETAADFS